ncbi:MAG: valine--tRNA ligase [Chitinophagaceae bacterium]|nr:valine--tRNA ligase [Chitinophagaceae bacterium]
MELTKSFEPAGIEEKWRNHWRNKKYYHSYPDHRPPFTIVIPPPNVTGVLHMGHTLNETVQDILVRKARMSGYNACWVPGSDHASIATEAKVVQMLENEKGIKKSDLSRDDFMKYAYEWKDKYGGIIYNQIDKLGCSVDWNRVTFTMDPDYYQAVIKVFVDLYNKGLIYRGARMINWDPAAKTALSDEEVEYKDLEGKLYYVDYEIVDARGKSTGDGCITIATQRPETIMGDTAVCVNPNDERYRKLSGKYVLVPLVNRVAPIIFDEYVDKEFGTGALKVTPAHDINDYNLGLKHNLQIINTLAEDGTLSIEARVFVGLDRFAARKKAIEQLKEEGLLTKEENYPTRIGYSQRTNVVVEPRISTQWFVKMKPLAEPALNEVVNGNISIHPGDKFLATYKYWLENVKDWCISRQLWWGQRIPAWYDEEGNFYVAESLEQVYNDNPHTKNKKLTQDDDVLDTWFSSWLWPMEVFKGISNPGNDEIKYYYPGSVLVTGQDIIFFWVARMIMAGMEYQHEKPFHDVYFTGMVRDKQGRKMSKSLGNSPDLLQLIDKFGADAVRFGIMISSPAGNDLLFDESSCEQGRFFNNKIWNALKLVKMWEANGIVHMNREAEDFLKADFPIQWFNSRLNEVLAEVEQLYKDFRLSEILKKIYSLIWDDFCSWYLEWVKPGFQQPIDAHIYQNTVSFFERLMQMLHPFIPFITEEIYHLLNPRVEGDDLTIKQFDIVGNIDASILQKADTLKKLITATRDARNKIQLKPKETIRLFIQYADGNNYALLQDILQRQVNAEKIEFVNEAVPDSISLVVEKEKLFIQTESRANEGGQHEQLIKDLEYLKGFLVSVEKKLGNERFVQNAKPEIVEAERKKKSDAEDKIRAIEESLKNN